MAILSKEQILAADDIVTEDVPVPEWGGVVRVRTLTGTQRDAFEATIYKDKLNGKGPNTANLRARFVTLCLVDESGKRMFDDADIKKLGAKSAAALQRVFDAGRKLSAFTEEDEKELVEDLDDDPSGDSTSDSPDTSG